MTLISQARSAIARHRLLAPGQRVLVAVSGGADSVALLHVLRGLAPVLGLRLAVAHLNHGIRGRSAARDAAFVAELASKLRLRFFLARVNAPLRARNRGISLEMAAREARYAFLAATARRIGADAVATAHNADDQAETVLLKLARGAGPRGMGGIRHCAVIQGVRVVRPLLDVSRAGIEEFLNGAGIGWLEDETNRDVSFLRNRVRHEILPLLESRLNPRIRGALARLADILREEDAWLDALTHDVLRAGRRGVGEGALSVAFLRRQPVAARRRALRMWLAETGARTESLDYDAVERIEQLLWRSGGGALATLPGGWRVRKSGCELVAERGDPVPAAPFRLPVRVPGETIAPEQGLRIVAEIRAGILRDRPRGPGALPARASLSLDAVGGNALVARSWRPGDRMKPLGMQGTKKIQDIFVDEKTPRDRRAGALLFECAGEIVWLPGYRVARGWEVRDDASPAVRVRVERV